MPRTLGDGALRVGDALRQSARMPAPAVSLAAASPDASWSLDPGALVLLAAVTFVYVRRWRTARAAPIRLASFLGGILVAAVALFSPVDSLGEDLFLMHMVQHILLLDVVPILCILGLTRVILRPVARPLLRAERGAGLLAHPAFAIAAYVAVMWVWHIPALYDLALENAFVHVLEHLFFAGAGALYWWHLLSPIRSSHLGGMGPVEYKVASKVLVV